MKVAGQVPWKRFLPAQEIGITMGSPPVIVTAGADGRLLGFDPRAAFQPLFEFGDITAVACQQKVASRKRAERPFLPVFCMS